MLKSFLFKPTLLRRLFAGYVVIILSLTLIVSLLISRQTTESTLEDIQHSLYIRAQFLAEISKPALIRANNNFDAEINQTIVELGNKTQSRLTLIDEKGVVLADSQQPPQNMDNHGQRAEVIAAGQERIVAITRFSNTLQQTMIYLALPVLNERNIVGYVRVSLPLTILDTKLAQLRTAVAFSALISALLALMLGFYFVKRFSSPLVKITAVAKAISKGDYSKRIITHQKDEIGSLANAFNRMARSSELRINQIATERNRLAMIFAGMVEGVIYVNEHLQIIHINQAAANMFDISAITSLKQPLLQQIDVPEIFDALQVAITNKDVVKTQIKGKTKIENAEVVDVYVAALNNDSGESAGAVVVLNDISELAHLERIRRDFVANASHELKTPITAIRGLTETILDDTEMPDKIRIRFMEKIKTQTLRLSSLVTDLMSLSRLEAQNHESIFEKIDLTFNVKKAIKNATVICQEKHISISNNISNKSIYINGDLQEIQQLIDNLIDNAIKYTPSNGNINIKLSVMADKVQFTVQDTGIGISEVEQLRIFERFYRIDKARSRDLGGTGLGLSIVKNIVEKHNGKINVESKLSHGSLFTVQLPLA